MKTEINLDIVMQLLKKKSSSELLRESLQIFRFSKKTIKKQSIIMIISVIVALFVGTSIDTQSVMINTIQTIIDIILALFGIVFTGYAFFQALINNELLIRLISDTSKDGKEEKSKLQETNETFIECMLLDIVAILLSLLLKIIIDSLPNDYLLFDVMVYNNVLATVLITMYFYFILSIMWEIKSFVFNLFQLFNAYAGTRILELLNSTDKEEE